MPYPELLLAKEYNKLRFGEDTGSQTAQIADFAVDRLGSSIRTNVSMIPFDRETAPELSQIIARSAERMAFLSAGSRMLRRRHARQLQAIEAQVVENLEETHEMDQAHPERPRLLGPFEKVVYGVTLEELREKRRSTSGGLELAQGRIRIGQEKNRKPGSHKRNIERKRMRSETQNITLPNGFKLELPTAFAKIIETLSTGPRSDDDLIAAVGLMGSNVKREIQGYRSKAKILLESYRLTIERSGLRKGRQWTLLYEIKRLPKDFEMVNRGYININGSPVLVRSEDVELFEAIRTTERIEISDLAIRLRGDDTEASRDWISTKVSFLNLQIQGYGGRIRNPLVSGGKDRYGHYIYEETAAQTTS